MGCIVNSNIKKTEPKKDSTKHQKSKITLRKIYLEPTTECNLSCRTCMRNTWEEEGGYLSLTLFKKLLNDIRDIDTLKTIAFWGIGEPLTHPDLPQMIKQTKEIGLKTELITNAMMLKENLAKELILSGIDKMVVSVDSTSADQLSEIRKGATLKQIINHVKKLNQLKVALGRKNPEIGIEFTVMKSNLHELANLRELALKMEASFIIVTNVLPYSEEHKDEILYSLAATEQHTKTRSKWNPEINLPRIDIRSENIEALGKISAEALYLNPQPAISKDYKGYCPFVERGAVAISWDGELSPCVPLMHTYTCFVLGREKKFEKYSFGNIEVESLDSIWDKQNYHTLRNSLQNGTFSPCIECGGGCELSDDNQEDCFGNLHPTCGDCLWAKGIIQCP